jgi:hypothetical protein
MTERTAKWMLFAAFVATVPVPYYMFVIAGLLPVSAILVLQFRGVWGFKIFNAVHLLIYLPVWYLAAKFCARWLFTLPPPTRLVAIAGIVGAAVVLAALPVYGIGHGPSQSLNIVELFERGL